jgi:uncharacterized phage-associated protein
MFWQQSVRVDKTIQAIGVLFRDDAVETMNYMRLLKLLYIADRRSYEKTGRPIVGGRVYALERGPVLQEVYDLIKGEHLEMPLWCEHFRVHHYLLVMTKRPDVGELSPDEIETLKEVAAEHRERDEWKLVDYTHDLPEWKKNDPEQSSRLIPPRDILEAVGRGGDADKILAFAKETEKMRQLFVRH